MGHLSQVDGALSAWRTRVTLDPTRLRSSSHTRVASRSPKTPPIACRTLPPAPRALVHRYPRPLGITDRAHKVACSAAE